MLGLYWLSVKLLSFPLSTLLSRLKVSDSLCLVEMVLLCVCLCVCVCVGGGGGGYNLNFGKCSEKLDLDLCLS